MFEEDKRPIIIYDDREVIHAPLASIVGRRGFGAIRFRNETLRDRIFNALPGWARGRFVHINAATPITDPETSIPGLFGAHGVVVIAARGALIDADGFAQQLERLALSNRPLADRRRQALVRGFTSVADFLDVWEAFACRPLHLNLEEDKSVDIFSGPPCLIDISDRVRFLDFIAGATSPREFNEINVSKLTYRKKSKDKQKLRAEHDFYQLIPASMKHWMVGAFNYSEIGDIAQYDMPRRFYADASLQWIHGAWDMAAYNNFLDRIFAFLDSRPTKSVPVKTVELFARTVFIDKVQDRRRALDESERGRRVLSLVAASNGGEKLLGVYDRYFARLDKDWSRFVSNKNLVIGHGDPCLSNILYDDNSLSLQLIDPKGAVDEAGLWAHELYDYCKLSHSILGDYDFINNRLFDLKIDQDGRLRVDTNKALRQSFQSVFKERYKTRGDMRALRLAEVSLFLSMLPLHLDHIDKAIAFLVRADEILSAIEGEQYGR